MKGECHVLQLQGMVKVKGECRYCIVARHDECESRMLGTA